MSRVRFGEKEKKNIFDVARIGHLPFDHVLSFLSLFLF